MRRRLLSFLFGMVMLLTLLCGTVLATGMAADPPDDIVDIDVILATLDPQVLIAGSAATLSVSAHFTDSGVDPKDYTVRVVGFSSADLNLTDPNKLIPQPFEKNNEEDWDETGWTKKITYPVSLNYLYLGGTVSLTVEISHGDERKIQEFTFPVDNRPPPELPPEPSPEPSPSPEPTPDPTPASISVAPTTVTIRAGRSNNISFDVVNSGETGANNLSATLTPIGQELQALLGANSPSAFTSTLNSIRRDNTGRDGNRGTFTYTISAPDTLKSGIYEFRVSGSYYHSFSNHLGVFEDTIQVVVLNTFEPVSLQIIDVGPLYPVRSGDLFNINIQIQNTGGLAARDAIVTLKSPSETSFTVMGSTAAGIIGNVGAGQSGNRTLTLRAAPTMESGTYPLAILLSYSDADGQQHTTEYETYIEVLGIPAAQIEMIRATVPGGLLAPGQRTVMTVELRNLGYAEARDVMVRLSGFSGTGLYLADEEDNLPTKSIDVIPAGGRVSVEYDVILSNLYEIGSLALQADISHVGQSGNADSITENISFAVLLPPPTPEPSDSPTSVPKLIIDRYTLSWEDQPLQALRAGAMFDLTFTLRNTSALTDLSNITVTLSSTDGIFLPAAGSNTFYIESVEIGGEIERTIRLVVSQSAESKSYPLSFNLDYEDSDGAPYRPSESLSLPVIVPLVVELANFNPPMWGDMGMQTYMMFQYINKGKSTVYNFSIEIEGEFMLPDGASTYIGNLASGYTDYFECMMIPMMTGELQGAVVLRFEDAIGNLNEMREEFVMMVNEPFYMEYPDGEFPGRDPWDMEPEEDGGLFGLPLPLIIGGGAGVVVVLAVITVLLIRRKKIKKRRLLEEDYDSDDEFEDEDV